MERETADAELRITGTVLRRCLVEGLIQRAWRLVGLEKQPKVMAPNLDRMISALADDQPLMFAFAGGPEVQGAQARFLASWPGKGPKLKVSQDEFQRLVTVDVEFWLRDYLESPCIYAWGTRINRRELILYVCNKVGGVHLDPRREEKHGHAFRLLDQLFDNVKVAQHRGIYYEFLSIGRTVSGAEDTRCLLERL